jgi:opacity protein-like surface antigen
MKHVLGLIVALITSSAALASDLPKKNAPLPPVRPTFEAPNTDGFYAGINGGYASRSENGTAGGSVGYQWGIARFEADYDRLKVSQSGSNLVTGNFILGHSLAAFGLPKVTPYALVGGGERITDKMKHEKVYNVGGGVRFGLTNSLDLDTRYRYVAKTDGPTRPDNIFTVGLTYKF